MTNSRHLPPAMPATGRPRREVRLKGAQWTPPRPRKGGLKARREVRLKGAQWTSPQPRQGGPKARREVRLKGAQWTLPRPQQGQPKPTSAQHQLPTPTKGTVRIPPRSFWMVYVALFPASFELYFHVRIKQSCTSENILCFLV